MSRRKKKKAKVVQNQKSTSPKKYIIKAARKLPILETYISKELFEAGMGHVIVVREKRNQDKVIGIYMVDVWCLGLKDTFFKIVKSFEYNDFIQMLFNNLDTEMIKSDPTYVFNVVYGAVEFADELGFEPHSDFKVTEYILDDVEKIEYVDINFGHEGKPYYVSGPFDNAKRIIETLNKAVGPNGFDFISDVEPDDEFYSLQLDLDDT
jgi:hypothetical protein